MLTFIPGSYSRPIGLTRVHQPWRQNERRPRAECPSTKRATIQATAPQPETDTSVRYDDDGTRIVPVPLFIHGTSSEAVKGVYAIENDDEETMYIGMSRDIAASLEAHANYHPDDVHNVRVMTFAIPSVPDMKKIVDAWIFENEVMPLGNMENWYEVDQMLAEQANALPNEHENIDNASPIRSPFESNVLHLDEKDGEVSPTDVQLDLTGENVDAVLNDVRPYLISDGGNISVVAVDKSEGSVHLRLEGACVSCASAATTMHMGVEKALKRRFGDQIVDIIAVDEPVSSDVASVQDCEIALDSIRSVLNGLGADVSVLELDEDEVVLSFSGPESLKLGVEQTLMEKVNGIGVVTFE